MTTRMFTACYALQAGCDPCYSCNLRSAVRTHWLPGLRWRCCTPEQRQGCCNVLMTQRAQTGALCHHCSACGTSAMMPAG